MGYKTESARTLTECTEDRTLLSHQNSWLAAAGGLETNQASGCKPDSHMCWATHTAILCASHYFASTTLSGSPAVSSLAMSSPSIIKPCVGPEIARLACNRPTRTSHSPV